MSHMNYPKPNTEIKGKSSHVGKRLQVFKTMGCGFSHCEEQSQYALVRGCGGVDWLGAHDERERVRPWTAICRAWLGVLATQLLDTCAQISWERSLVCWGRCRTFAKLTLERSYFTKAQRMEIISLLQVLALFCHKHDINTHWLALPQGYMWHLPQRAWVSGKGKWFIFIIVSPHMLFVIMKTFLLTASQGE